MMYDITLNMISTLLPIYLFFFATIRMDKEKFAVHFVIKLRAVVAINLLKLVTCKKALINVNLLDPVSYQIIKAAIDKCNEVLKHTTIMKLMMMMTIMILSMMAVTMMIR